MGREWHFGGRSSRRAHAATADHHRRPSLPGCMSTLFHFFDFHSSHFTAHFVFNKHYPKASHHGVEAPRNSLELNHGASISCLRNKEENLQIQMELQIKTRNGSTKSKASEQQQLPNIIDHIALESPSAKTPNLLARLMGLDILPQTATSSHSSSHRQQKPGACYHISGTRSLPESPRVSSARLSDVDRHHRRLSLQINVDKENIKIHEEIKREEKKMRRKVTLVDITNNSKKLEFSEPRLGFISRRSKVEKSSKRLKKTIVDESKSKLRDQEVINPKKQKQTSIPMARPKPQEKAKPREDGSHPAAKIPHEQPCSYPKAKQKPQAGDGRERNDIGSTATTDGGAAEIKYIKSSILTTHDISINSALSNRPVSPSIFHHLETTVAAVEEFPRANCEVPEDIDALIDKDLGKWKKFTFWRVAEIQKIVKVVEFHILDSLLRETTAAIHQNGVVF